MALAVQTVTGPVDLKHLGFTLPHEHLMVDFIGAAEVSPDRYNRKEVIRTMLPYLLEIKKLGVDSFIDCTPPYLGRDPKVLRELSMQSDVNIISCTGIYNKQYIPRWAMDGSVEEVAEFMINEAREGMDGTGILPGFIKTAVLPDGLDETEKKLIRAAALACRETGLTIGTHTGKALPAREILAILREEGVDPSRWVFIHAQNEEDNNELLDVADSGCWIELDGLGWGSEDNHLAKLLALKEKGHLDRVMLSQDAGWYRVGEPDGGEKKPFTPILTEFCPLAKENGISDEELDRIFRINTGKAFSIRK